MASYGGGRDSFDLASEASGGMPQIQLRGRQSPGSGGLSLTDDLSPLAFQAALVQGDRAACARIVDQILERGQSVISLYEDYFKPALYGVGHLWEHNQLSIASEHLATAIVESLMNELFPRLMSLQRQRRTIVVAPVAGELHQIGGRMVCDLFEMHGWDAIQLDADASTENLLVALRESCADFVGLSISLNLHLAGLQRTILAVRAAFPLLPILVGGRALAQATPLDLQGLPGVLSFRDLFDLRVYLERLGRHQR